MKFKGILLCSDLDGTLLADNRSVSKENLDAIEYFKSEGGYFTFITGRPPKISGKIYEMLKPNAPIGCYNGGGVYDFKSKSFLWSVTLPVEAVELIEYVDTKMPDMGIQVNTGNRIIFSKDNSAQKWFREVTGVENDVCHYKEVQEPIIKVVFAHDDGDRILQLTDLLNGHPKSHQYDFIRSEEKLYELLPKGISKGNLLLKIAEILGIDPKNTVAVGDYNNDISMIKAAGIGYAVANAVPEVIAAADRVTVSYREHAIAKIIEEIGK